MKKQILMTMATTLLVTGTAFAQANLGDRGNGEIGSTTLAGTHTGDVRTRFDVRLGNYKVISISNSSELRLTGLTCSLTAKSQSVDNTARNEYDKSIASDVTDVSGCYPGSSAILSVGRSLTQPTLYTITLSLTNAIPHSGWFVNNVRETRLFVGANCTTDNNRLNCQTEDGGKVILELL